MRDPHYGSSETLTTESDSQIDAGLPQDAAPLLFCRTIDGAARDNYSDPEVGFWSYGFEVNDHFTGFSVAIKDLWETCTGLTLP